MNMVIKSINEARILAHLLKTSNYQGLLLNNNAKYTPKIEEKFTILLNKFNSGYPMDYILGKTYFLGDEYLIKKGVLIPRTETEYWIQNLQSKILQNPSFYKDKILIDVGCGSGIIGLSLAKYFKKVILIDLYKTPLKTTQNNIKNLDINNAITLKSNLLYEVSNFYQTHILPQKITTNHPKNTKINLNFASFDKDNIVPSKQIDFQEYIKSVKITTKYIKKPIDNQLNLIVNELLDSGYVLVSNPPYVPNIDKKNIDKNKIKFEPKTSIFSNQEGLSHFNRLINQINDFVLPSEIYVELDVRQKGMF